MMNQISTLKMRWMPQAASFLLVWLALFFININWSRDRHSYFKNYEYATFASTNSIFNRTCLIFDWCFEPGYYFIQALFAGFLSYSEFIGVVLLICLSIKYFALLKVSPKPTWGLVLPYLFILGFLHEGTQIRVALALSIILWSFIYWAQARIWLAFLLVLVAAIFHISAVLFMLVFLVIILGRYFGVKIYLLLLGVAALLAIPDISGFILIKVGELTNARYLSYARGPIARALNVTGLFQYYFIFPALLGLIIWRLSKPKNLMESRLSELAIVSSACAIVVLQDFRFNTVIASRFADLLLLPVSLQLGIILNQLYSQKRIFFWGIVGILLVYCMMRGYVSFSPRPPSVLPAAD